MNWLFDEMMSLMFATGVSSMSTSNQLENMVACENCHRQIWDEHKNVHDVDESCPFLKFGFKTNRYFAICYINIMAS
jgi:hypothetical protein